MTAQFSLFATTLPSLEGSDIRALAKTYSADLISTSNTIRKPYAFDGHLWVVGNQQWHQGVHRCCCYRAVPANESCASPLTYRAKVDVDCGRSARSDPQGFYHGVAVSHAGRKYILEGPEVWATGDSSLTDDIASEDEFEDGANAPFESLDDETRTRLQSLWDEEEDEREDDLEDEA